jgi:hypothetical protein
MGVSVRVVGVDIVLCNSKKNGDKKSHFYLFTKEVMPFGF